MELEVIDFLCRNYNLSRSSSKFIVHTPQPWWGMQSIHDLLLMGKRDIVFDAICNHLDWF